MYIKNPTQEQRILNLLEIRGEQGVEVYELITPRPNGLGIAQYNSRIWGLRQKGHNILSERKGHFVLTEEE